MVRRVEWWSPVAATPPRGHEWIHQRGKGVRVRRSVKKWRRGDVVRMVRHVMVVLSFKLFVRLTLKI